VIGKEQGWVLIAVPNETGTIPAFLGSPDQITNFQYLADWSFARRLPEIQGILGRFWQADNFYNAKRQCIAAKGSSKELRC